MVKVLEVLRKIVGLVLSTMNIWKKICTYRSKNGKDPSGLAASDGSERK